MAYVDENLLPAERVVYRAHLHPIIYAGPFALALGAVALFAFAFMRGDLPVLMWAALPIIVIALVLALIQLIHSRSSEFAVTNRRVVIKTGVIRRHTLELLLPKVEGIGVDQTIIGRLLNLGTIVVIGTGGSKEEFAQIANPLEMAIPHENLVAKPTPGELRRLINEDKVPVLLGPCHSVMVEPMAPVTEEAKMVLLEGSGSVSAIAAITTAMATAVYAGPPKKRAMAKAAPPPNSRKASDPPTLFSAFHGRRESGTARPISVAKPSPKAMITHPTAAISMCQLKMRISASTAAG